MSESEDTQGGKMSEEETDTAKPKELDTAGWRFQRVANISIAVGVLGLSYALMPGSFKLNQWSLFLNILHLGTFGIMFGTQFYTTFVAGFVLIRTLPRHMFGLAQSGLFPIYFTMNLTLSTFLLAFYLLEHPAIQWHTVDYVQVCALLFSIACNLVSYIYISPVSIDVMFTMHAYEEEAGVANEPRQKIREALKDNEDYNQKYRRFMILHGVSSLVNLASFCANVVHLYYLASKMA